MDDPRRQADERFTQAALPECHHVCLIYDSEDQRRQIVSEFLAAGIREGALVRYFADTTPPPALRAWLSEAGKERTHALTTANAALSASRRAAIDMMKAAVETRRRAEQASAELQREVAEHKRVQREYRTLLESVPDFIVRYDLNLRRIYVNPAWERASGLTAAEVVGEMVRQRTTELEAANKELEAFAYSVSHDLRAPLRHIDGFLDLLQKKTKTHLDDQSRHYMDTIGQAAKKMGLLIDDLLSFSRMGRQTLSFQPVEMGPLVRDVIRELEPDTAGMTIDWRIGDLPAVRGDAAMLRIVLTNLIANALKFTRTRKQAVIEIGSLPGQETETVIYVRDNGVGFDMAYADRLFGVFQRLHRAEEFEGTGIGLATVHRIIARHGGRTWAEGNVDQGATFCFLLSHSPQGGGDEKP
jgi:signal transduction histidine kinase